MQITMEDFLASQAKSSAQLIDVREPHEFEQGHISGARNIPLGDITTRLDDVDRERDIILVCLSGKRSLQAATFLKSAGFKNAVSLEGGMLAWNNQQK